MTTLIENFAISGYRSFGNNIQYFDEFKKINIFIGKNNSGKSNILRFIDEIFSKGYPEASQTLKDIENDNTIKHRKANTIF